MTTELDEPGRRASLRQLLKGEHDRLEQLFEELLAAFSADAREDAGRLWGDFDARLSAHMDLEERMLLPAFSASDPAEAGALLQEHEQIREKLTELGVGVDLHLTRVEVVNDFVELLRGHARREDALIYRWAEGALSEAPQARLREQLGDALRSFRERRSAERKAVGHGPTTRAS